jgi:hypothetical protein
MSRELGKGSKENRGASVPRSYRSMSLKSAPDRSYDVPPADEREGKAKAEGDRNLGKIIITHGSTLTRDPAGTRAASRQEDVAGMNYLRRPAAIRPVSAESRGVPRALAGIDRPMTGPQISDSPAGFLESPRGHRVDDCRKVWLADGRGPRAGTGQNQHQSDEDRSLDR